MMQHLMSWRIALIGRKTSKFSGKSPSALGRFGRDVPWLRLRQITNVKYIKSSNF